jgi:glycerol-3-phosphate O-acyltransferase
MSSVTLPLWLLVVLVALAVWAVSHRLLGPAFRWFMSRRAEHVIDDVSTRLRIGIRLIQRTPRDALIGRLLADAKVQRAAEEHALQTGTPLPGVLQRVQRYAREIVPAFNAYIYFHVGYWLGRRVAQLLYRVRVGSVDEAALASVPPDATVVFVMNHRSNMDYILVGYLVAEHTTLSYAVGEWARIWPLSMLVRAMGAFFIRRHSRDELYRRVLEAYVAMATEAGVPQAVFPEGKLSRTGGIGELRFGVIDYMMRSFRADGERDLVFVPIALNYDRVLEDRTLLLSLDSQAAAPGRLRSVLRLAAFVGRNLRLMVLSRWYRFGYACVNIGSPVSMREYCRQRALDFTRLAVPERQRHVADLGRSLMDAVGRLVPVVPVPMIARVFAEEPDVRLSAVEVADRARGLAEMLRLSGAHVYIPRRDFEYAIAVGLRGLRLRHVIHERDGTYSAAPEHLALLQYYANSIAHLLPVGASSAGRFTDVSMSGSDRTSTAR